MADAAIDLLAKVGMRMAGSSVLPLLAEHGAGVDLVSGMVRIPRQLTESVVAELPRTVLLGGLRESDDVTLGEDRGFHFCPSGCVAKTLDFRSGQRRPTTLDDVRLSTALLDEMSELDLMWTQVSATDVPLEQRELLEYFTVLTETSRHVTFVDCPREVDRVVALFEALAGDLESFRRRPRISTVVTAASPLQVDGRALDVNIALASRGAPVEIYSMAIAGATSPVTLAGTVVQGVAEFLGIAVALRLGAPQAKVIFCFSSGILDMLQTTFAVGSLESALMAVAATEVGHHLGVPTLNAGLSTDANYAGPQSGYEKALKGLTVCAGGADIVNGWGLIESHNTMSLVQIVIDNEVAAMIRRLLGGIEISEETMATATIERVGPGGDFLREKETARRVRAGEHFLPAVSTRLSYERWKAESRSEVVVARERVERILRERAASAPVLDEDRLQALVQICRPPAESVRAARRERALPLDL